MPDEPRNPIPRPASEGNGSQELSVALFHDVPVRIAKDGREAIVPIRDIAAALTYDRQALHQIVQRNSELFEGYRRVNVTLTKGDTAHTCLTRDGVIALLVKLDYQRIKDPAKRQRIIEFQRWAAETLGKVIDGAAPQIPAKHWTEVLKEHLQAADMLARCTGRHKDDIVPIAIQMTEAATGMDLARFTERIFPDVGFVPMQDDLTPFLNECCRFGDNIKTPRIAFWEVYTRWCQKHQVARLSRKRAYQLLRDRGVKFLGTRNHQRVLWGIDLNPGWKNRCSP